MASKKQAAPGYDPGPLGVTADEFASKPELILDLLSCTFARRMVTCQGVMALLGANAHEKVATRYAAAVTACSRLGCIQHDGKTGHVAPTIRDAGEALAALEYSLTTLAYALCARRALAHSETSMGM